MHIFEKEFDFVIQRAKSLERRAVRLWPVQTVRTF